MKRILIVICALMLFTGCVTFGTVTQTCTIYQDVGATVDNSLIAKLIKDPCVAQRILATTTKLGVIWKPEYIDLFDAWAAKVQAIIEAGVTYQDLQNLVIMKIVETNQKAGMILLVVSDGIFVFDGQTGIINAIDRKLLLMSLADLRAQVAKMKILMG